MDKKTSMKDIASHLGVSTALVSYVLNNKQKEARVSDEMADKIRKAAEKLNYTPNLIARSLKSGKTNTLGLIVADISNPFFSNIARIIEDEAKKNGYTVIFGSCDENTEKFTALVETLVNRQVDGLIIAAPEGTERQIKALLKRNFPFVLIDRYFPGIKAASVSIDNFKAAYEATTHLIANGYKRIGMVNYKNSLFHSKERNRGYLQALADHKLKSKKNWLPEVRYHHIKTDLKDLLGAILTPSPDVDALLFATNSLAVNGLRYINTLGINVPEELGLISFDESDAFDFFYSPVTYVKQSVADIGAGSVKLLLGMINEQKAFSHVEARSELIVRKSSAGMQRTKI